MSDNPQKKVGIIAATFEHRALVEKLLRDFNPDILFYPLVTERDMKDHVFDAIISYAPSFWDHNTWEFESSLKKYHQDKVKKIITIADIYKPFKIDFTQ